MKQIIGDLNLYKIFYVVAKSSTFSSAAKKLYISQPAISYSIKTLESQLNCKLFCRNTKNIALTFEGFQILNQIETAINLIISAETKLQDIANLSRGHISIGIPSHLGAAYLLPKIKEFKKEYPNISYEIINKSTNEILKLLNNKNIEMVIDTTPINIPENSNLEILQQLHLCFATYPEHWQNMTYSKFDLSKSNLILPPKNSNTRELIDNIFRQENIELTPVMEVTTTEMIKLSVINKFGIGLFIKETIEEELKAGILKEVFIDFELPQLNLCLVYFRKDLSMAAKEFLNNYLTNKKTKLN